ncbi:hypothetical protein IG631_22151 [Alternaria alternata]|nr:hypothetical protein IG631_22151 [Alternaria alternata]
MLMVYSIDRLVILCASHLVMEVVAARPESFMIHLSCELFTRFTGRSFLNPLLSTEKASASQAVISKTAW